MARNKNFRKFIPLTPRNIFEHYRLQGVILPKFNYTILYFKGLMTKVAPHALL